MDKELCQIARDMYSTLLRVKTVGSADAVGASLSRLAGTALDNVKSMRNSDAFTEEEVDAEMNQFLGIVCIAACLDEIQNLQKKLLGELVRRATTKGRNQ